MLGAGRQVGREDAEDEQAEGERGSSGACSILRPGLGPSSQVGPMCLGLGRAVQHRGSGLGGPLSDSLGFTLQGRQKPLCVQALTSSSTSHPTPPGPFKKKKILSGLGVGVRALVGLGRETVCMFLGGDPEELAGGGGQYV